MLKLRKDKGVYHLETGNDYVQSPTGTVLPVKEISQLPMAQVDFSGINDGIQEQGQ